jgi:hypothetical protein
MISRHGVHVIAGTAAQSTVKAPSTLFGETGTPEPENEVGIAAGLPNSCSA